jgi:hypothetical protein
MPPTTAPAPARLCASVAAERNGNRALAIDPETFYILHILVVLAFQALLVSLVAPPLAKFALVTAASIPVTFLIAGLVRKPLRL